MARSAWSRRLVSKRVGKGSGPTRRKPSVGRGGWTLSTVTTLPFTFAVACSQGQPSSRPAAADRGGEGEAAVEAEGGVGLIRVQQDIGKFPAHLGVEAPRQAGGQLPGRRAGRGARGRWPLPANLPRRCRPAGLPSSRAAAPRTLRVAGAAASSRTEGQQRQRQTQQSQGPPAPPPGGVEQQRRQG